VRRKLSPFTACCVLCSAFACCDTIHLHITSVCLVHIVIKNGQGFPSMPINIQAPSHLSQVEDQRLQYCIRFN